MPKFMYDGLLGNMTRTTANAAMLAQQQKKNIDEAQRFHQGKDQDSMYRGVDNTLFIGHKQLHWLPHLRRKLLAGCHNSRSSTLSRRFHRCR